MAGGSTFNVTAHDGTDLIGEGTHERALIDLARFEAKVKAKAVVITHKSFET